MRHARAVLEELMRYVQPPKGCVIVLTERPLTKPADPNWVATVRTAFIRATALPGAGYSRRLPKPAQPGSPEQAKLGNGLLRSRIGERSRNDSFDRFDSGVRTKNLSSPSVQEQIGMPPRTGWPIA
jgi:hypothetical protein